MGFTLVAALGADTILTSYNFHKMTVLSFFQNWVLFLVGFIAELLPHTQAHDEGTSHPKPLPVPAKYRAMLGACLAANVFFTNIASSLLTYVAHFTSGKFIAHASLCAACRGSRAAGMECGAPLWS